jgi:hypothetical protein
MKRNQQELIRATSSLSSFPSLEEELWSFGMYREV